MGPAADKRDSAETMSRDIEHSWEVVCPDGRVRDYPYTNEGDAESMAQAKGRYRCQCYPEPGEIETSQPPCPEGEHAIRRVAGAGIAALSN